MRVLLNALQAGNRSGTGRYVEELVRALPRVAPELDVKVVWPAEAPVPDTQGQVEFLIKRRALKDRLFFDQFGMPSLRKEVAADSVHYPANFGPVTKMRGLVVTVHDVSYLREPQWFPAHKAVYYRRLAQASLPRAAHLIADSRSTANDLHEFLHIPAERVSVVPLGVTENFEPADDEAKGRVRARYKVPEKFLLYVGTIEPRKNLVRLIAAWSRCAQYLPDLVIAGREGWSYVPVREAAEGTAHRSRIHFPGFVAGEDLPALLSAAHAFVWPSLFEGFGLPPLEAMACGTPVLTSNTSSIPEVTGDAALLVDPLEVDAIEEGLRKISEDNELRGRLRERGKAQAKKFTWENCARFTVDAYRKAAET